MDLKNGGTNRGNTYRVKNKARELYRTGKSGRMRKQKGIKRGKKRWRKDFACSTTEGGNRSLHEKKLHKYKERPKRMRKVEEVI